MRRVVRIPCSIGLVCAFALIVGAVVPMLGVWASQALWDMPLETLEAPTMPADATIPPTTQPTIPPTAKPTGTSTAAASPTASATWTQTATPTTTSTPTPAWVHLPLVQKNAVGLIPTLTPSVTPTPTFTYTATATSTPTHTPTVTPTATPAISEPYGSLSVNGPVTDRPAAAHPDINLSIRGYAPVNAVLTLIDLSGSTDTNAPNLRGLCASAGSPTLCAAYQVYNWDWGSDVRGGLITNPEVTLLGLASHPGELVFLPASGYDLGEGYDALVLYARSDAITLKYTREDNVVRGYTIHLEGIVVDPALLTLYNAWDAEGRGELPALDGGQAFGWAAGTELRVAIRDTGSFMETRSRKDWWR